MNDIDVLFRSVFPPIEQDFNERINCVESEISDIDREKFCSMDDMELLNTVFEKLTVERIELKERNREAIVRGSDSGTQVTFRLPFSGDGWIFKRYVGLKTNKGAVVSRLEKDALFFDFELAMGAEPSSLEGPYRKLVDEILKYTEKANAEVDAHNGRLMAEIKASINARRNIIKEEDRIKSSL